jgi:tRNA(Ile)-lysidine synthase
MPKPAIDEPIGEAEAAELFRRFEGKSSLVLAVSGGPDSIALMWLLARWRDGLRKQPRLVAATVDHGLRAGSADEALAVKRLAEKLNVEHRTMHWTGEKPTTGIQEAARDARYRLLADLVIEVGAPSVLTAHTLDDQAETLLFRLARGSGVSGLAGMRPNARTIYFEVYIDRPLLGVPKSRLVATLESAGIPYVVDPSNFDPKFARARFRTLMPVLAQEGLTADRLGKLAKRVQRLEDALRLMVRQAYFSLAPPEMPPHGGNWSCGLYQFTDLPAEIAIRLLGEAIGSAGREEEAPELAQLETLHDELREAIPPQTWNVKPGPFRRTLAGAMITLSGDKLLIERAPPRRTGAKTGTSAPKPHSPRPR